jgi:hypothetical protein
VTGNGGSASNTVTRYGTIVVVDRTGAPVSGDGLAVDLEIREDRWAGYAFRLTFLGGSLIGVEVQRVQDDAPLLTADHYQEVPIGALERVARLQVDLFMQKPATGLDRTPTEPRLEQWSPQNGEPARLDRSALSERELRLARLAKRYVETLGTPEQAEVLATELGYSPKSIPALVMEARNVHHLLTPTQRGRPGGRLTPKALDWLGEDPEPAPLLWEWSSREQRAAALWLDKAARALSAVELREVAR